jgi:hypothetical protein
VQKNATTYIIGEESGDSSKVQKVVNVINPWLVCEPKLIPNALIALLFGLCNLM